MSYFIDTWAMIDNETFEVTNIIVWDGSPEWAAPKGVKMLKITEKTQCSIGSIYDPIAKTFSAPPAPERG